MRWTLSQAHPYLFRLQARLDHSKMMKNSQFHYIWKVKKDTLGKELSIKQLIKILYKNIVILLQYPVTIYRVIEMSFVHSI